MALSKSGKRARLKRIDAIARLGWVCAKCKQSDLRVLEFDHIVPISKTGDPRIRSNQVVNHILGLDDPRETYQLLCANCHRIKTWGDLDPDYEKTNRRIFREGRERERIRGFVRVLPEHTKEEIRQSPLSYKAVARDQNLPEEVVLYIRRVKTA